MQTTTPKSKNNILYVFTISFFLFVSYLCNAQVGIGTTNPLSTFEVNGSVGQKVTTLTANTTLDENYSLVICNNGSTAIIISLPAASGVTGRIYTIKREASSNANVTISGTIDGVSNLILAKAGEAATVFSNGTEWKTLNNYNSSSTSDWNLTGNAATTAGVNFVGTTDATDLVVKTNALQRLKVTSAGVTIIGDGTNDTKIDADGSFSLEGSATAYTDIVVPIFNSRLGNDNNPTWAKMKDNGSSSRGVYTYTFSNQSSSLEQEVFFSLQLPHNWKEGSSIYPHVHWSPQTTGKTGSVVWGLEYTWVNYNATTPIAFPNTIIITATSAGINGSSDADKHLITALGTLTPSGTQDKISSVLMCRFYRKSGDDADTYNGNAAVLSVDFHYEMDGIGSHTLYVK